MDKEGLSHAEEKLEACFSLDHVGEAKASKWCQCRASKLKTGWSRTCHAGGKAAGLWQTGLFGASHWGLLNHKNGLEMGLKNGP